MEKKIAISYDKQADVMYLNFGRPENAEAIEIKSGIWIRISPKNKRLVGLTILNFSKKFSTSSKEIKIELPS